MTNGEKYRSIDDRVTAFRRYCADIGCPNCCIKPYAEAKHNMCVDRCILKWLALEAEEDKPLTCPFCGSVDIKVMSLVRPDYVVSSCYVVSCCNCGAVSRAEATKTDAIAAWNRRAK